MFVADLHNDVLQRAIVGEDISIRTENGHSDLVRLKESCIDLEVFVVWVSEKNFKESAELMINIANDEVLYEKYVTVANDFFNIFDERCLERVILNTKTKINLDKV